MDGLRRAAFAVAVACALLAAPAEARTRVGLAAGALSSRFADGGGDPGALEREPRRAWGGGGGIVVQHALGGPFALIAGLEYAKLPDLARVTNHGLQFFNGGQAYEFRTVWAIDQDVLLVPLRIEYRRGPLRVGLGPQVRYLAKAWRQGSEFELVPLPLAPGRPAAAPAAQIFEDVGTFSGSGDATRFYERWTFSATASVGLAWPVAGHELRTELRGFTDLSDATKDLGGGERARVLQLVLAGWW